MAESSEQVAVSYLKPLPDAFWRWSDDCAEICWTDGSLIAFRGEVAAVLEKLAPGGLPYLDGVILLIAATRNAWNADIGKAEPLLAELLPDINSSPPGRYGPLLSEVLEELVRISKLPPQCRVSVDAKVTIASIVFGEDARPFPCSDAQAVINHLRPGLQNVLQTEPKWLRPGVMSQRLLSILKLLAKRLPLVTAESVQNRGVTSLDELPAEVELEEPLPPAAAARRLIDRMQDDPDWAGVARTARRLIAATGIPRPLSHSTDQEAGGLSDISNRGPLDRLLLSELANDSLTLAVRVAMNEALYLRREAPPGPPEIARAIFIDVGLRTWGLPRLYAASLGLAFVAGADKATGVNVVQANGGSFKSINLTTRDGLVEQLSTLAPELSPAVAVARFLEGLDNAEEQAEPVLIVAADTANEPAFRKAIRDAFHAGLVTRCIIASCDRDGRLTITDRTSAGEKQLRQLVVSEDDILAKGPRLVDTAAKREDLPAIFAQDQFPLLLPHPLDADRIWYVEGFGAHAITGDGRLMRWTESGEAAYQICDTLPKGRLQWASGAPVDGRISFVVGGPDKAELFHVGRGDFSVERHRLAMPPHGQVEGFAAHGGMLFSISPSLRSVTVYAVTDGSEVDRVDIPPSMKWIRDRFFTDRSGWYSALSYDGQVVRLTPMRPADSNQSREVRDHRNWLAVFERAGYDGQFAVTNSGQLVNVTQGTSEPLNYSYVLDTSCLGVPWISCDGTRFQVSYSRDERLVASPVWKWSENLQNAAVKWSTLRDDRVDVVVSHHPIRHRFSKIGVNDDREIVLTAHSGSRVVIRLDNHQILLRELPRTEDRIVEAAFDPIHRPGYRYRLSKAKFASGAEAFIDSRGLLHLRPVNPDVPELSLVMSSGALGGWCSDGTLWGNRFYTGPTGDLSGSTIQYVYSRILKSFAEDMCD